MQRYLEDPIRRDLSSKIILLSGPRQSGKTTMSRALSKEHDYLNFDEPNHRQAILDRTWDRRKPLVVLDELHKMRRWKSWLKGIFDVEGIPPALVVTGSARLDTVRKVGDSLAGRFFPFRLHPLDIKEVAQRLDPGDLDEAFTLLLEVGGFPEPYLKGSRTWYNRWKRSHMDVILRQDMVDLEMVRDIASVETLVELLRTRVGSPVSYSSLARDLQVSDHTVKRWLTILENLYVIFRLSPYHRNVGRSLLKAPKFYFFDNGQVLGSEGARFENAVACSLLKEVQFARDVLGEDVGVQYLRLRDGREVDFIILRDRVPELLVETKLTDGERSPHLVTFAKQLGNVRTIQLCRTLARERTYPDGSEVRAAPAWLSSFSLARPSMT